MYRNPAVNPLVIVLAKAALVLTALSVAGQVLKFALVKRTPGRAPTLRRLTSDL